MCIRVVPAVYCQTCFVNFQLFDTWRMQGMRLAQFRHMGSACSVYEFPVSQTILGISMLVLYIRQQAVAYADHVSGISFTLAPILPNLFVAMV